MKKFPRRKIRRTVAEINVVPYIDVMLVLLVIFMITAPLLSEGVKVSLPQATTEKMPPQAETPLIITIDATGKLYLNVSEKPREAISSNDLLSKIAERMKNKDNKPAVLIKGDKDVDYGKVVQTFVLLQQAGVEGVGLMTEPLEMKQNG